MDACTKLFKEYIPENNLFSDSYYEIQKLVYSLGLPAEMIHVFIENYMIYWKNDEKLWSIDSGRNHDKNRKEVGIIR